jgi:hypothetical protein
MARKNVTKAFEALVDRRDLPGKTISVRCGVVYSYAEPIAHLLFNRSIAITDEKFSATTSSHCNGLAELAKLDGYQVRYGLNGDRPKSYHVRLMYRDCPWRNENLQSGMTLEEAQSYCSDPETSSETCTSSAGKRRTEKHGPWFVGYGED